jgi:hypothetical protein
MEMRWAMWRTATHQMIGDAILGACLLFELASLESQRLVAPTLTFTHPSTQPDAILMILCWQHGRSW